MQGQVACKYGLTSNYVKYIFCSRLKTLQIYNSCNLHKKVIYEKLNIPSKPKKPLTPYFKYLNEIRPTLQREFPDKKITEITKLAAQKWASAEAKLKEKLVQQYNKDLEEYRKIKDEYEKSITAEQKAEIKRAESHLLNIQEERKIKKKSKELGKPKQPLSSFLRFLDSKRNEQKNYSTYQDWLSNMSKQWKNISLETKTKFEEDRKQELEKWYCDLKDWEDKMIKEGNLELVRSRSLLPAPPPPKKNRKP